MSVGKYLNKNKIGALVLIVVIIIAFGFGGFGGGFLSNNQNNIAKIDKTNITTKDFINYVNQSGISQKAIQENLNNNIIEELLSSLISTTLLDLEIKDFDINFSQNSLLKKIKLNDNFIDKSGVFQRTKYEKFLLENNISAPIFEKRLKNRELQKKLFNFIGAGTVSPQFLITKLFKNENRKLELDFVNLESFYKKKDEINDQDLIKFIDENEDQLKVEYIDFKYSVINPQNLIGVNEFNKEFFDKIDEIENNILNGVDLNSIISEFNLNLKIVTNYKYSDKSNTIEKKIFENKNNNFDIIETEENFILFKIDNIQEKKPDINDLEIKEEIFNLVIQKNKFDYNKKILEQINNKEFTENNFLEFGDKIQSLTLNSIKDNKRFDINSVQMLYSLPINTITLINDEEDKIYLAKVKNFKDVNFNKNSEDYKSFIKKENTRMRNSILQSYDLLLNAKYKVNTNQIAIDNVKNLFQ
tara:strand:- start:1518 stop:2933 length:1416 start_codon:yes stop_codon:yes gene_type:complete